MKHGCGCGIRVRRDLGAAIREFLRKQGAGAAGDIEIVIALYTGERLLICKKNIFKLSQGEYVAFENLENDYSLVSLIDSDVEAGLATKTICDMVAVARYMNVTLIVPELDKTSFWKDQCEFQDVFDVGHFITSLRDEIEILEQVPHRLKKAVETRTFHSMAPVSWSNISYYLNTILPRIQEHELLHLNKTDARLANNGIPLEVQRLRCRVNYKALKFTSSIEKLGKKIVNILRKKDQYLALHLRYEMDMLAFSGCTEGCTDQESEQLTKMRYAIPWWKEKVIDSAAKRTAGLCPMTPEETALTLKALGIDQDILIYIAAGDIYGGKGRLASLREAFPNLVKKETLLPPSELAPFQNHSSQMAALDYIVSLESDIFIPTYKGNMARVIEGHRRYLGFKKTIVLDRRLLVNLIDRYKRGTLSWKRFSVLVKKTHEARDGSPRTRIVIPGNPKEEDNFWSNPQECLSQVKGDV
ncbi:hypothetical protein LguiA_032545 [Lonicera macranthoides]